MRTQGKLYLKSAVFILVIILVFVCPSGLFASLDLPADAKMYYSMGEKYMAEDNFDMAVLAFEKAVNSAPYWPEAHNSLGEAYVKLLRFDDALNEFDRALNLKKDYPEADKNRRRTMTAIKQYKPMKGSRLRRWHKVAILGGITAAIAIAAALIISSSSLR